MRCAGHVFCASGLRAVHSATERSLQLSLSFKASVPRGFNEVGRAPGFALLEEGVPHGETSKIYIQITLGLVKNRQTPKTFNKGKKIV